MKKRAKVGTVLFVTFVVIVIVAIALFLVFYPKNNPTTATPPDFNQSNPSTSNPGSSNPGTNPGGSNPGTSNPGTTNPEGSNPDTSNPGTTNPEQQTPSETTPGTDNPQEEGESSSYATTLKLLCPSTLTMCVNEEITLQDGFIKIEPSSMKDNIEFTISSSNKNGAGLTFKDNTIKADTLGDYQIVFSVQGKTGKLTATLNVEVTNAAEKVRILKDHLVSTHSYQPTEIFEISNTNYRVEIENKNVVNFENGVFYALEAGQTKLFFCYDGTYVTYSYCFTLIVDPKPREDDYELFYSITKEDLIQIEYHLTCSTNKNVNQELSMGDITISDNNLVRLFGYDAPYIVLEPLAEEGSFTITLTFHDRGLIITKTIEINLSKLT